MINMKFRFKLFSFILFFLNIQFGFSQNITESTRRSFNFNTKWVFLRRDAVGAEAMNYNDKSWVEVSIPHTMRLETKHNGGNVIYQGIGWYRRYFRISKAELGKRITLNFEGVQKNCEVFLNGEKLKEHFGGYLGFVVDITDKVKYEGNNVLAVRVSSSEDALTPPGKAQGKMDFNYYGGIFRLINLLFHSKIINIASSV